jgi:hypothetical protein
LLVCYKKKKTNNNNKKRMTMNHYCHYCHSTAPPVTPMETEAEAHQLISSSVLFIAPNPSSAVVESHVDDEIDHRPPTTSCQSWKQKPTTVTTTSSHSAMESSIENTLLHYCTTTSNSSIKYRWGHRWGHRWGWVFAWPSSKIY